jgi:hypothetical protein
MKARTGVYGNEFDFELLFADCKGTVALKLVVED